MENFYSVERNTQMLISLLKEHNIKKIILSPGATNVCFVGSVMNDSFFELYSCVDERSASYMACGLAEESGEPVVLNCTGATASRNYIPGLTEAFYRKLPILAVTASQHLGHTGNMFPQMLDRSIISNDIAKLSVSIPTIHDLEDEWSCNTKINEALLELCHNGGGPVHINLVTQYKVDFSVKELPSERVIHRYDLLSELPEISKCKIAVFVGAHKKMSEELTSKIDSFCKKFNAVVLCDQTSNYRGKYRVLANLLCCQDEYRSSVQSFDIMIHLGEISGSYMNISPKTVWRVNPDGKVRDPFKKLTKVFEMEEIKFFELYLEKTNIGEISNTYLAEWQKELDDLRSEIPELPFSNLWIAKQTAHLIPPNSVLHLGILNSLRSWNYFETPSTVCCYSNTGGFGIDGCVSTLFGASLFDKNKLYFGVFGDLAFFYDLNSICNRHIGNNLRIMLINNGRGQEFRNYSHKAAIFGEDTDKFISAAHHNGDKSPYLIKHYAEDLGFEYLCAYDKTEYLNNLDRFVTKELIDKPILFEVFTDSADESDALKLMNHIKKDPKYVATQNAKNFVKGILGEKSIAQIKRIIKG